jgi:hypothetical protein
MTKTVMSARVTDQHLTLVNVPLIASGGVDEIRIHFQFCGLWDGCGKTAVFYRDPSEVYHVPIADGSVIVPHEVLTEEGFFYFGVMGTGDNIRTSEVVRIYVTQGAITTATANHEELTPDIYQQILAAYGRMDTALAKEAEARRAEIAIERARLDNLAAMKSPGGVTTYEATNGRLSVRITSNGIVAHLVAQFTGAASGPSDTESCDIPVSLAPLGNYVSVDAGDMGVVRIIDIKIADVLPYVDFQPSKAFASSNLEVTLDYALASGNIAEVEDIRVGYDGTPYANAGAAVREQVANLNNKLTEGVQNQVTSLVEALCPPFSEKGHTVRCEPVKGYPINVRSYFGAGFDSQERPVPYDDFEVELTLCGKNLYDRGSYPLTAGSYVRADGKLTSSTGYACTKDFVPVSHLRGKQITLNHPPVETEGSNPKMIFYTAAAENAVISGSYGNGYTLTVPDSATHMRFSVPRIYADGTQIQIELGTMVTAYEPYRKPQRFTATPHYEGLDFYQGYFDWNTGELYNTHDLVSGQPEILEEKPAPVLVATTDPTVIQPEGSSIIYGTYGDTEVSGRANPGALIDILTRRLNALSTATAAIPVGGGAL